MIIKVDVTKRDSPLEIVPRWINVNMNTAMPFKLVLLGVSSTIVTHNTATNQTLHAQIALHGQLKVLKSVHRRPVAMGVSSNSANKKLSTTYPDRMRLGVEHPAVLPICIRNLPLGVLVCVDQVGVLEHFGKEEGFLEVGEIAAVRSIHVGDGAVAAADAGFFDDGLEPGERPLGGEC